MEALAAKIIADFTPGAVGIWALVLMFAVYFLREWRETRKLSLEDRLARRDGYAKQVSSLQVENRELRSEVQRVMDTHDAYRKLCHAETDQLRKQLINMADELQGYKRQLADQMLRLTHLVDEEPN